MSSDFDKFGHLIVLRNCVVHAWGDLSKETDLQRIRDAVSRIDTAVISQERFLFFGDQVVPEALVVADRIVRDLVVLLCANGGPSTGTDLGDSLQGAPQANDTPVRSVPR
jgi:hypothetical protein